MHFNLAALLVVGGLLAVLAAVPQLTKLVRLKHTAEFSLFSWVIWLAYQLVSVAYSLKIRAYVYVAVNAIWSVFYLIMVFLIIKYRKRRRHKIAR